MVGAKNAVCGWDFTDFVEEEDIEERLEEIREWCKDNTKKWSFQLERGENTGKLHFQGRISLNTKVRLPEFKVSNWSVTHKDNTNNDFYVTKAETREKGPWTDKQKYIPRQIRGIKLWPWQQSVVEMSEEWDTRKINMIIDLGGCVGKSTLVTYMGCYMDVGIIPYVNCYKDIMRMVYNMGPKRCYLIDMPRALGGPIMKELYAGLESVKGGFCYDDRYEYKHRFFDCPNIFVFVNARPKEDLYTPDRWRHFAIGSKKLVKI